MSRPPRSERLASIKGRPKRRAAKTHFFKYQLATNPSRAEENDLKRALQASMEEQRVTSNGTLQKDGKRCGKNNQRAAMNSSTNSSDVSKLSNNSSSSTSADSCGSPITGVKRTRSSAPLTTAVSSSPASKRAKIVRKNDRLKDDKVVQSKNKCDSDSSVLSVSPTTLPKVDGKAIIRTYSRSQSSSIVTQQQQQSKPKQTCDSGPRSSTPLLKLSPTTTATAIDKDLIGTLSTSAAERNQSYVSRSTQTSVSEVKHFFGKSQLSKKSVAAETKAPSASNHDTSTSSQSSKSQVTPPQQQQPPPPPPPSQQPIPVQEQYLKFKRESKNYAYVKMTALRVSTSKSPSSNSKNAKKSPNGILNNSNNKDSGKTSSKNVSTTNNHSNTSNLADTSLNLKGVVSDKSASATVKFNLKTDTKQQSSGKRSPTPSRALQLTNSKTTESGTKTNSKTKQPVVNGNHAFDSGSQHDDASKGQTSDFTQMDTNELSMARDQNLANLSIMKQRVPQGSWSLLGVPEEKLIYLRDDEPPQRLICYPAIKHVEGDVIQVRDSVLLRSGAKKTDLPYIAKVCSFWEDAQTGAIMMSLFWYYRPEHTEDGRKPHHLPDEIFASRHRDVDSVECIEDKCYVLTFNEYCRFKKRCKMEQVNTTWSLADVTIPVSNESYPRRNRIPEVNVNPELVFCCRQIYDSRMKRLVKNPLINPKYGHI